ncbi:uncharacterized protein LOC127264843 [Andrographis paniculata]|uniref:uncharacterized protein LOC127264843 n=1 Tax=Andrographis paniculata TaxID=175694 RepID=UPI0021E8D295|nr:uncharacterized protein LOC127264843 [Andrographis paniculata]
MDWYSWLSKTNIDPKMVYHYAGVFVGNDLQEDDLPLFTHDFLQSIGVAVAKHRLEILKRAAGGKPPSPSSRLVSAINKTRKLLKKNIAARWAGIRRIGSKFPASNAAAARRGMWSGPLAAAAECGGGVCVSFSGPLDGRSVMANSWRCSPLVNREKKISPMSRWDLSPKLNGAGGDGGGVQSSLWSLMFHDIKPT